MPTSETGIKQIIINRLNKLLFVKDSEMSLAHSKCYVSAG